ncbi:MULTISPECIES: hypothetical protein [unclassified Rhodococcus (in: high G+C Gram-positive bacteria)]|uniref:hypothetical protein n=1 Tax=unclassified Rhodococcus (in: high G+C Gram-positive bacteria) TaxID=192944 RepID=UPI000AB1B509|nr:MULTISPECIES: hypothetical protein [unclassified Rhodococcus (in: high G+C Gram-positive bacteria)]
MNCSNCGQRIERIPFGGYKHVGSAPFSLCGGKIVEPVRSDTATTDTGVSAMVQRS